MITAIFLLLHLLMTTSNTMQNTSMLEPFGCERRSVQYESRDRGELKKLFADIVSVKWSSSHCTAKKNKSPT